MTIIADRIQKATRARRFRDGYEPSWIHKADTFNPPEAKLPSAEPDQPVELGALEEGDAFAYADGSGHGIVTGAATGIAMTQVDTGTGNRYVSATTPVVCSAPERGSV